MSSDETNNQPAPSSPSLDEQISGIAVLGDPLRRALYRHVISQPGPVNRDQVAEGAGVARHVVKFHLDRLADDGLLDVEYARPAGRAGPGAGRPAKLYRRSARELAVSLPPRDYELAGRLLAQAVTEAERDGIRVADALARAARSTGQALGRQARQLAGPRPSQLSLLAAAINVLIDCGYEPRGGDERLTLANCPFHGLAEDFTDLVCGMNLDLLRGLVEGVEVDLEAHLEPAPGLCCVRLRRTRARRRRVASPRRRREPSTEPTSDPLSGDR